MLARLTMQTRRIAVIALFAALTAAGSMVKIPLAPVPVTLQSFFVLLAGVILGPRDGAISQSVYVISGLLGLPVFSGGGSIAYVMRPSFGFLLGFICAPYGVGLYLKRKAYSKIHVFIACLIGTFVIYLVGMPYLALYLRYIVQRPDSVMFSIKAGMLIFLPGDMLKCAFIAIIAHPLTVMVEENNGLKK